MLIKTPTIFYVENTHHYSSDDWRLYRSKTVIQCQFLPITVARKLLVMIDIVSVPPSECIYTVGYKAYQIRPFVFYFTRMAEL